MIGVLNQQTLDPSKQFWSQADHTSVTHTLTKLSVSLITTAITSSPAVTVKCVFGSLSLPLTRNGTSREIPLSTKAVLKRVAKGSFIVIVMA